MEPQANPKGEIVEQYRRTENLSKRVSLHTHFSVNPYPWQRWVFDHLDLPSGAQVLELGAGTGALWRENLDRLPETWEIVLTDLSPGMLASVVGDLTVPSPPFAFRVVDAQALPFEAASFDGVIANHMLYHVPSRERALAEVQRVLKPGGRFYASTVGTRHMYELWDLAEELVVGIHARARATTAGFTLENGRPLLERWFTDVHIHLYDDALVVTEAEPLIAYVLSSSTLLGTPFGSGRERAFRTLVERRIATQGRLHIRKATGLFSAGVSES